MLGDGKYQKADFPPLSFCYDTHADLRAFICRIFIIEGLATVVIGAASKFFTVDWPEAAKFLTDEERKVLVAKLAKDHGEARMDHLDKRAAKRIFKDWKIYCGILMYLGIVNTGYSGSVRSQLLIDGPRGSPSLFISEVAVDTDLVQFSSSSCKSSL